MSERDFTCSALHGEIDQRDGDLIVEEFRSGSSRVFFRLEDIRGSKIVYLLLDHWLLFLRKHNVSKC